jgi:hypothetical protein
MATNCHDCKHCTRMVLVPDSKHKTADEAAPLTCEEMLKRSLFDADDSSSLARPMEFVADAMEGGFEQCAKHNFRGKDGALYTVSVEKRKSYGKFVFSGRLDDYTGQALISEECYGKKFLKLQVYDEEEPHGLARVSVSEPLIDRLRAMNLVDAANLRIRITVEVEQ